MKFKLKAALAVVLATVMALAAVPVSALPRVEAETPKAEIEPYWTVPDGYNSHDYNKCVQFLEQTDADGVKNGEKLSDNYDPNVPETWGNYYGDRFEWTNENGEQRICLISISNSGQFGNLNMNGCDSLEYLYCDSNNLTELKVSDCFALKRLSCRENQLAEIDISGCTAIEKLECTDNNLIELNLSCCTWLQQLCCDWNDLAELDLTQCIELWMLECSHNNLVELDVSQNTELLILYCSGNSLTELDITQNTDLDTLRCFNNNLTELDITQNAELDELCCFGNKLTELDLSNNSELGYDYFCAEGSGFVAYLYQVSNYGERSGTLYAYQENGAVFDGFYNESGALISEGEWSNQRQAYIYRFEGLPTGTVIARFSGGDLPGDLDGNGRVSVADAISTLRLSMGISDGSGMNTDAADMDGNGNITLADAIVILRMAMGLA